MATRTAAATAARLRHSDCQNGTFFTWSAASFSGWGGWYFFFFSAHCLLSFAAGLAASVTFGAVAVDPKASIALSLGLDSATGVATAGVVAAGAAAGLPNV